MHSVVRPRLLAFAFAALAGASAAFAQNTVTLDLQTTGQWNAHFRRLANVSGGSAAQNASGFFRVDVNTTNTSPAISHAAYVFDTTPADATLATQSAFDTTAPVTVSLDVRSTNAASVALIFADAENPSNNVLALFDLKTGNDTVRFYKDGARNTAGTTFSVGTQVGATTTAATTAEPAAGALFTNFTVTLDLNGSTPTLLVEVDGVANPITYTFYKGNIDWARTTVIVRIDDGGGATVGNTPVDLDNVIIQSGAAPASPVTANTAARLEGSSARTIAAGRLLVVANPAVDFDVPRQTLTYALTQAPAGATIDAEGTILWRPDAADVSATPYTFTTDVSDNGSPVRTATNTFDVTVTSTVSLGAFTRDLDFLAAGQFDSFFRSVTDVGGGTRGQLDTRLVLDATSNGGNQSQAWLFDTTPADPAAATQTAFPVSAPVTVSFQARVRASDSSLAVLFADSRNALNNVSAVLNLRNGTDLLRFFRDGSLTRRSTTAGTQVGSDNVLTTTAEPLYPEYLPVTVTLSASGSTPTLSVKVGDAAPIVSAFAAGDLNWTTTLVLLRLNDANSATNTALQLNNLVVGGATPVTPVPPTYTAAPGVNGNLLTTNPSFESGTLSNYSGTYTLPGWDGKNLAFAQHSLVTGSVAAGTTTDGMKKISQRIGGELVTAVATRAAATAGVTYEFAFDQSVLRRTFPNQKLGTFRYLEFFDDAGIRIQQAWGTTNDYKVAYDGPLNTWQTWTLRGVAPVGTASVGVRIENPTGQFVSSSETYVDDRDVEIDHVRLTVIPDTAERIAVRRAPRLVEPGKTATLKLHALALSPRTLRATLLDSGNTARATASVPVPAGRSRAVPVNVAIPSGLANGTYSWRFELVPTAGGAAVATFTQPGVLIDQSVVFSPLNTTDFPANHPRIQYQGRIEDSGSSRIWHWFGSEVRLRFSGTSLSLSGAVVANIYGAYETHKIVGVVNEDFANPLTINFAGTSSVQTLPLVSGLPDGVHTLRLYKATESNLRLRLDTFRVDAGKGLLAYEPLPSRRLEVYGDSVTNGSSAVQPALGYSMLVGRELDTDFRNIAKGGSGIASSFINTRALISNFYDNLTYQDIFNPDAGLPYDMSQWTPQIVLFGFGHNDQFNGGAGAPFNTKYAEIKANIRAAYPGVKILSYNTVISANLGHFLGATAPLTAADPDHRFAFQPFPWNDSNTAHPPTDAHAAMVYGDERRFSLADVVEDLMGWGLDGTVNLLPNGGFESGLSGWTNYNNATSLVTDRVEGAQAARVGPSAGGVARFVGLPAGTTTVSLAFQAKATTNQASTINLKFFNASYVQLGSTITRNVFGSATQPWTAYTPLTATVPAGATLVEVSTWSPVNNQLYLDALVLEATP